MARAGPGGAGVYPATGGGQRPEHPVIRAVLLPLLAGLLAPRAAAAVSPASDLAARAHELHLAEDIGWLRLGHWRKTLTSGYQSQADGPDFFLAEDGKTNPAAELTATLRAMYGELQLSDEQRARQVVPPECRFPARAAWLIGKLQPPQLPQPECRVQKPVLSARALRSAAAHPQGPGPDSETYPAIKHGCRSDQRLRA